MVTETDLAWAAGFIDGEGCIFIGKRSYQKGRQECYSMILQASQRTYEPIEKLKDMFGGSVAGYTRTTNAYHWVVASNQAAEALRGMLPYLVLKRPQAEVAIAFQERRIKRGGDMKAKSKAYDPSIDAASKQQLHDLKKVVIHKRTESA